MRSVCERPAGGSPAAPIGSSRPLPDPGISARLTPRTIQLVSETVSAHGTRAIDELTASLASRAYLADRGLATVLHVALALGKPLLLEDEAGVGKTEVAKTLADVLGARLIRLQCYEGIDAAHALYDWSYARQMLAIRLIETGDVAPVGENRAARLHDLFS